MDNKLQNGAYYGKKVGVGLGRTILSSMESTASSYAVNSKDKERREMWKGMANNFHDTRDTFFGNDDEEDDGY